MKKCGKVRKERKTEAESNVLPYAEVGHQKVGANVSTASTVVGPAGYRLRLGISRVEPL